jgi:hypothetical protein
MFWIILINTFNFTKGTVTTKVGTSYPKEWRLSNYKGEQTPTNIDPPYKGHQTTPQKWHYTCF